MNIGNETSFKSVFFIDKIELENILPIRKNIRRIRF